MGHAGHQRQPSGVGKDKPPPASSQATDLTPQLKAGDPDAARALQDAPGGGNQAAAGVATDGAGEQAAGGLPGTLGQAAAGGPAGPSGPAEEDVKDGGGGGANVVDVSEEDPSGGEAPEPEEDTAAVDGEGEEEGEASEGEEVTEEAQEGGGDEPPAEDAAPAEPPPLEPARGDTGSVDHPPVSAVPTPTVPAPQVDPDQARQIAEQTGRTVADHVAEATRALGAVAAQAQQAQGEVAAAAEGAAAAAAAAVDAKKAEVIATGSQGRSTVGAAGEEGTAVVDGAAASAATTVATAVDAAKAAADAATETGRAAATAHVDKLGEDLGASTVMMAARFEALAEAKAVEIESYVKSQVDSYVKTAEQKASKDFSDYTGAGAAALNKIQEIARDREEAKVVKKYTDAMTKAGAKAARELRAKKKDLGGFMAENFHAPTVAQLYPAKEKYEAFLQQKKEADKAELDRLREQHETQEEREARERKEALAKAARDAQAVVDATTAAVGTQADDAKERLANETRDAAGRVNEGTARAVAKVDEAASDAPAGSAAQAAADGIREGLTAQRDEAVDALATDASETAARVGEQADARREELATASGEQADRIRASADEMAAGVTQAAQSVADTAAAAGGTTTDEVAAAAQEIAKAAADSAAAVGQSGQGFLAEAVNQKLDTYVVDSRKTVMFLLLKMQKAVESARSQAGEAELKSLKTRSDGVWKAIDGAGTTESLLLKSLKGMTKVHGQALRFQYQRDWGCDIQDDIEGDTSGSLEDSCLYYLDGDQVKGAKHALEYSASPWQNPFFADTAVMEDTLRGLNEKDRQALLSDPEFEAIKTQVTLRLSPMGAIDAAVTQGFAGYGYDLDVFNALTDKTKTKTQAETAADAVRLHETMAGQSLNPFTWGTDEKKLFEILGKRDGAGNAQLAQAYEAYAGVPLKDKLVADGGSSELSGHESDRALAQLRGDKGAARAAQLRESAEWSNDAKEAMAAMENKDLGNETDWLAGVEAQQEQEQFVSTFNAGKGKDLHAFIDDEYREHDADEQGGAEDNRLDDALHAMARTGKAESADLLAYGVVDAGTREEHVKKALQQLKDIADPERRRLKFRELKAVFKERYGIEDLGKFLGLGEWRKKRGGAGLATDRAIATLVGGPLFGWLTGDLYVLFNGEEYDPAYNPELSGQDAFDVDVLWQELELDDAKTGPVVKAYELAKLRYDFYRGSGSSAVSNVVNDVLYDTGEVMEDKWNQIEELYADTSWYDPATGQPKKDAGGKEDPRWKQFQELTDVLDRASEIYKGQREAAVNAITGAITLIGAIVVTALTAGAGAPAIVGAAVGLAFATANIVIKTAMLGDAYGEDQAAIDLSLAILDAFLAVGAGGLGKGFKGWDKLLDDWAGAAGARQSIRKLLALAAKSAPGPVKDLLSQEDLYRGDNLDEILVSTVVVGVLKGMAGNLAGDKVKAGLGGNLKTPAEQILVNMVSETTQVLVDPKVMQGDSIGWELLKANMKAAATGYVTQTIRNNALTALNAKGELSGSDWNRVLECNDDVRGWLARNMKRSHLEAAPESVLTTLKTGFGNDPMAQVIDEILARRAQQAAEAPPPVAAQPEAPAPAAAEEEQAEEPPRPAASEEEAEAPKPAPPAQDGGPTPPSTGDAETAAPSPSGPVELRALCQRQDVDALQQALGLSLSEARALIRYVNNGVSPQEIAANASDRHAVAAADKLFRRGDVTLDGELLGSNPRTGEGAAGKDDEADTAPPADTDTDAATPGSGDAHAADPAAPADPREAARKRRAALTDDEVAQEVDQALLQLVDQDVPEHVVDSIAGDGSKPREAAERLDNYVQTKDLRREGSRWVRPDGTPATDQDLAALKQRFDAEAVSSTLPTQMDREQYKAHVRDVDQPLDPESWQVRQWEREAAYSVALSQRLQSDPDLLEQARRALPSIGEGTPDEVLAALDRFKVDAQFASFRDEGGDVHAAYGSTDGFEGLLFSGKVAPTSALVTAYEGDIRKYGNDLGRDPHVYTSPLDEVMDMTVHDFPRQMGIIKNGSGWDESQAKLSELIATHGRDAGRQKWIDWVEGPGAAVTGGFKEEKFLFVVLNTPELQERMRYIAEHKQSGITEVTLPQQKQHELDVRYLNIPLNDPGQTIGEALKAHLKIIFPHQADLIEDMDAHELSEYMKSRPQPK